MNEFLNLFYASLKHMRADEKQEILQDFREHFEIGLSSGKTEDEIAKELGDPRQLARMYSAQSATDRAIESKSFGNVLKMLGAILSLKVGGGLLMGVLYFVCVSTALLLFAAAALLITAGAGCAALIVLEAVYAFWMYSAVALFGALALICGGLLWWLGTIRFWKATVARLPLLARRIMRGRGKAAAEGGLLV